MPSKHEDQLSKLADLLDCPRSAFDNEEYMPDRLRETAEMFRIWFELGPSDDRTQLLAMARTLVNTQRERQDRRYK